MDTEGTAFAGAAEQVRMLAAGRITSPELVELYLDRIARFDGSLNAYRVVRGDAARAEAIRAQRRLDAGERLPLLGVPIAIKDDVDVAGEVTAWGTAAHGPTKESDAEIVRMLRAAGAIVLGKTNVPEMTIWPFTESPTFGATRNPWDLSRSPGGSSGGTAAAIAAGLAPFGLGSDGGGSIRTPATWCGLYGLKPQRGRVALSPHDDGWHGLIVNGPLTRTVEDAALFLDVTSTLAAPQGGFVAAAARTPTRFADSDCDEESGRPDGARRISTARRGRRGSRPVAPSGAHGDRPPARLRRRTRLMERDRPIPAGPPRRRGDDAPP